LYNSGSSLDSQRLAAVELLSQRDLCTERERWQTGECNGWSKMELV